MAPRTHRTVDVYLEAGTKRVFACAVDLAGWCRSGTTEDAALEALLAYAPRYAPIAAAAGIALDPEPRAKVVDRVLGTVTTDFGAPDVAPDADQRRLSPAAAGRQADLLVAAWSLLDDVAAHAPAELRKGPRGGGRDRDAIVEHVIGAEVSYARTLGLRHRQPEAGDGAAVAAVRASIEDAIRAARAPMRPDGKGWPVRYVVRRMAWHVLDHAWEIQDRSVN